MNLHKQYLDRLYEKITIDVNIGDTILMGKFKNKKTVVKSIGKDEYGMPLINGKKATTFRLLPKTEQTSSGDIAGHSSKYAFIKKIKDDEYLAEKPHVYYKDADIPDLSNVYADFNFEKMKLTKEEKNILAKSFYKNGVMIKMKNGKFAKITQDDVVIVKDNRDNLPLLPKDWQKYITVTGKQNESNKYIS